MSGHVEIIQRTPFITYLLQRAPSIRKKSSHFLQLNSSRLSQGVLSTDSSAFTGSSVPDWLRQHRAATTTTLLEQSHAWPRGLESSAPGRL